MTKRFLSNSCLSKKGFTLLEILLVVGIIAILAAIVILAINPSKQLASVRNTVRKSDLKQVYNAIQQYYIDNGSYPANIPTSLTEICNTGTATSTADFNLGYCDELIDLTPLVPAYIVAIPVDPQGSNIALIPTANAATNGTGYLLAENTNRKVVFTAPQAELGEVIITGDASIESVTPPAATYTINYDGNDNDSGTVPTDPNMYSEDDTVTVLNNTGDLAKTGYTFTGWNTQADGLGIDHAASSTFIMGTSSVVLYAVWEEILISYNVSFTPATPLTVGANPTSVFSADFNGDGKKDIATTNLNSNNVSIHLGVGDGTFTVGSPFSVGTSPFSVVAADFDNDNDLDMAVANYSAGNLVSIRLGDGSGSFTGSTNVSVGSYPHSVFSADFNNDSNMDIATANVLGSNVSIRLGDGSGGFTGSTNINVGTYPRSVYSVDINNDNNKDIIVANTGSNNISTILGNGAGGFAAATNVSVGAGPYSVFSTDLNNDGNMDIITANSTDNNVSVLLGNGSGGFTAVTPVSVGSSPVSIFSADFNNDGYKDIVTANNSGSSVSIRLGDGSGGFTGSTNINVGSDPFSVFATDFDGDGNIDIAVANYGSNSVSILLNTTY